MRLVFFKPLRQQVQECSLLGKAFNLRDFSQDSWVNQSVLVLCENWPFKNSGSNSKPQLEVQAAIWTHTSCPETCPRLELAFSYKAVLLKPNPRKHKQLLLNMEVAEPPPWKGHWKPSSRHSGSPVQLLWQAGFAQYNASQNSFMITRKMSSLYLS